MKVTQVKFKEAVNIAGYTETLIHSQSQVMRVVDVEVESDFLRFKVKGNTDVLVPMYNVSYIHVENDKVKASKTTEQVAEKANSGGSKPKK